jgi:hypothetical protein
MITMSAEMLYRLIAGQATTAATTRQAMLTGDPVIAHSALESLHGVLAGPMGQDQPPIRSRTTRRPAPKAAT